MTRTPRTLLDPKLDAVFSLLFGAEGNRPLLVSLLNAVLSPATPIAKVEVLPERPERLEVDDKGIVLDLRVALASGEQVDVEMQSQPRPAGRKRALYYWSRLYAAGHRAGDEYDQLRRCVVILITNFRMLRSARFHSIFRCLHAETLEPLDDDLEIHVLELPKMSNVGEKGQPDILAWGKFLNAKTDAEIEQLAMQYPGLKPAKEALERLSADPEARLIAERRETALRLHNADFAVLRDEADAREAAARAEGRAQGALVLRRVILSELTQRGLTVTDELRDRIEACEDLGLLEACWQRARSAQRIEDVSV